MDYNYAFVIFLIKFLHVRIELTPSRFLFIDTKLTISFCTSW